MFRSMKRSAALWFLMLAAASCTKAVVEPVVPPELATLMGNLQRFAHKLTLSIEAENAEAAGFYLAEIKEALAEIEWEVPSHDGIAISPLIQTIARPALGPLDSAITARDWEVAKSGNSGLVDACNRCHAATEHPFLVITVSTENPFNQNFDRP